MSTLLKCPNPSCPYTFDPAQVPTGVVLSCPRCATQFTLGAPVAPAAPPTQTAPPAQTRAGGPARRAPTDAPPSEPKVPRGRRPTPAEDSDEPPARHGAATGTGRYQTLILVGIAAVLMASTALVLVFAVMRKKDTGTGPTAGGLTFNSHNVTVDPPPPGWQPDHTAETALKVPFVKAYKRENPEGYVIYGFTEYDGGKRAPRGLEMRSGLEAPFRRLFTAYERDAAPAAEWMGLKVAPEHGFKFRASSPGLTWQGEAYTVTSKGVAYFWVGWCPEGDYDALKDEFAAFRGKFRLLNLLDKRKLGASEFEFKGARHNYVFTDTEALWVEVAPRTFESRKAEQPELDRWLEVNHTPQHDKRAIAESADLQIVVLDGAGAGDPLARAKDYVEGYWTKRAADANIGLDTPPPVPMFTVREGPPEGDPPGFEDASKGKFGTPVLRLECALVDKAGKNLADTDWRLVVVSAVAVKDKVVVMHGWCKFAERKVFEARLAQIASSLRASP